MQIVKVIYPGGRAAFAREYLAEFKSLDELKASPVLKGIKGRDAVLEELYGQSRPVKEATPADDAKTSPKRRR